MRFDSGGIALRRYSSIEGCRIFARLDAKHSAMQQDEGAFHDHRLSTRLPRTEPIYFAGVDNPKCIMTALRLGPFSFDNL